MRKDGYLFPLNPKDLFFSYLWVSSLGFPGPERVNM